MKVKEKKNIFCSIEKCLGCKSCEIACAVEHSKSKDLFASIGEFPLPRQRRKVEAIKNLRLSTACQHCESAGCIDACMSGAIYKDDRGAVLHDEEKCVGCWMCIMACPFGVISRQEKIALKCDLCPDRDEYACVKACPTRALCAT
ncbi:4Fe-4S dicluster domain-containing protein [Candidatus Margulisiibacteriota bacterium]